MSLSRSGVGALLAIGTCAFVASAASASIHFAFQENQFSAQIGGHASGSIAPLDQDSFNWTDASNNGVGSHIYYRQAGNTGYADYQMKYDTFGTNLGVQQDSNTQFTWLLTGHISGFVAESQLAWGINTNGIPFQGVPHHNNGGVKPHGGMLDMEITINSFTTQTWSNVTFPINQAHQAPGGTVALGTGTTATYSLKITMHGWTNTPNNPSGWSPTVYVGIPNLGEEGDHVPAPGAVALLGLGGAFMRRRRR